MSSGEIKSSPVWIAPDEVNEEFNSFAEPILERIMANEIENQKLTEFRNILLPRLMSGEIDVSNVAI